QYVEGTDVTKSSSNITERKKGDRKNSKREKGAGKKFADGAKPEQVMRPSLYNLKTDISEEKDLADANPEIVRELQKLYDAWNAELVPPLWGSFARTPQQLQNQQDRQRRELSK
ncbi:MAG: hypothetical protein SGJ20_11850, partial [Planctomycetota bacterium]|nr:hypothetical protein [Planctomycetota bacterium]